MACMCALVAKTVASYFATAVKVKSNNKASSPLRVGFSALENYLAL